MTEQTPPVNTQGASAPFDLMDRYWRAANYLSVGQIYLMDNPLLREPLRPEQIKPRLLGHWGTTPGLNFIYVHLNRIIRERDRDVLYICGPGHGGPGTAGAGPRGRPDRESDHAGQNGPVRPDRRRGLRPRK